MDSGAVISEQTPVLLARRFSSTSMNTPSLACFLEPCSTPLPCTYFCLSRQPQRSLPTAAITVFSCSDDCVTEWRFTRLNPRCRSLPTALRNHIQPRTRVGPFTSSHCSTTSMATSRLSTTSSSWAPRCSYCWSSALTLPISSLHAESRVVPKSRCARPWEQHASASFASSSRKTSCLHLSGQGLASVLPPCICTSL